MNSIISYFLISSILFLMLTFLLAVALVYVFSDLGIIIALIIVLIIQLSLVISLLIHLVSKK